MAKPIREQIRKWATRLKINLEKSVSAAQMEKLGNFAKDQIVKRTRLGGMVSKMGATKEKFPPFVPAYLAARKRDKRHLHWTARPSRRSNTFTGQMLEGMQVIKAIAKTVWIGSLGRRFDGKDNADIARWVSKGAYKGGKPRPFNWLSDKEIAQVFRFWRKTFGDLKGRFR
jgi:hypothetical protein